MMSSSSHASSNNALSGSAHLPNLGVNRGRFPDSKLHLHFMSIEDNQPLQAFMTISRPETRNGRP